MARSSATGATLQPGSATGPHDPAQGGIVRQPVGIVHVFVASQSSEHELAQLCDQRVAAILARPGIRKSSSGQLHQPKRIVKIPKREQPSVGRDLRAVKFQLQVGIKRDPESGPICFTRRTVHLQPR